MFRQVPTGSPEAEKNDAAPIDDARLNIFKGLSMSNIRFLSALAGAVLPATIAAAATDSAAVLRELKVEAQTSDASHPTVGKVSLGALGDAAPIDLPYSVQVATDRDISERGAHSLLQAVSGSTPIYAVMLPSNDGRGDAEPQLRGLDPNFLQDGLPVGSGIRPEVEACDHIEILDGPTAALYGFSGTSLGGTVNYRLKAPVDTSLAIFGIGQYAGSINDVSADLGGALNSSRSLNYRFNAYREKGEGYVRGSSQEREFVLAALDWKPVEFLKLKASASHHEFDYQGQQISFAVDGNKPWVPDADLLDATTLYGEKWSFVRGTQDQVLGGFAASLGPVALEGNSQFAHTWRQSRTVSGTLLSDASGNYSEKYSDGGPSDAWNWTGNAKASTKLSTGIVSQEIALGYVGAFNLQRSNVNAAKTKVVDTSSINNPVYASAPELFASYDESKRVRSVTNTVSLEDKAAIGSIADLVAGIGYSRIVSRTVNELTGASSSVYDQDGIVPTVGLVVKPLSWLHPYANWSRGLVAGGMSTTSYAKNVNEYLSPSTDDAFEVGVKSPLRLAGLDLDLSADVYYLDVVNEYLDPADSVYKQDGREVHRGAEIAASGRILSRLKVAGSFSWIDAWVDKALSYQGNEPVNIPEEIGRLSLEYAFAGMPGLSAGTAVNWSGERAVDAANTVWLPSYATFDASIRYRTAIAGHGATLQANVTNLTNVSYWAAYKARGTVGLVLGEPRTLAISTTVEL